MLYESSFNKILAASYWYLNVGTLEKKVTTGHFNESRSKYFFLDNGYLWSIVQEIDTGIYGGNNLSLNQSFSTENTSVTTKHLQI